MKRATIIALGIMACAAAGAQNSSVKINVDASKQLTKAKLTFNGTNIEDINNQTYGGIFSQLLYGEAFEESIDVDFLNFPSTNYVQIHVVLDETGTPHLLSTANAYTRTTWNNMGDEWDFNKRDLVDSYYSSREIFQIGDITFHGRFCINDSIPAKYKTVIEERLKSDMQTSRYWRAVKDDAVKGSLTLERGHAYMGRQSQVITLLKGKGEIGVSNSGLNHMGIDIKEGMPYEGCLRLKSRGGQNIYVSLRSEEGKILCEEQYQLRDDSSWEKINFKLIPKGSDPRGQFVISLRDYKASVELGYAFLQPGEWGRVNGLHVRKPFIDALKKQGITVIRYNGSMVDCGIDRYLYRWKNMIGPIDERRICFRNGFNPFATMSFGIIEMLEVAEALGAQAMIGMNIDETYQDIKDFVEYVNGSTDSKWGALRAAHGHPAPYNLKMIQVHNEQNLTRGYLEAVKKYAKAAWESDPEMNIITSLNIGQRLESYAPGSKEYELAKEMICWFADQGKVENLGWDPHYDGTRDFADKGPKFKNQMGINLQENLFKDTGYILKLYPMEENGSRCDWDRGLAHAHNWNTLQRYSDHFIWLGTANTFQPFKQFYMWDQGRIHYTSNELWFQPSAYIDEMMSSEWLPNVVEATSSDEAILDVTAKMDETGKVMKIYVCNLSDAPCTATINVTGFKYKSKAQTWTIGGCELTDYNTVDAKETVAPVLGTATVKAKNAAYTFPKYSYTAITLKQ